MQTLHLSQQTSLMLTQNKLLFYWYAKNKTTALDGI